MFGDIASTGFGTVTTDLGRAMLDLGLDVRFLSQNELGDLAEPFRSRTFVINEDRIGWHVAMNKGILSPAGVLDGTLWDDGWTPDAALLLGDFYAARGIVFYDDRGEQAFRDVPTYHYVPVEGVGLPPAWAKMWSITSPIAMSEFGADQIAKITGTRPPVVYHGVDTSVFFPVSAARPIRIGDETLRSKDDCKAYFGKAIGVDLRPWTVCLRTDTNVPRKNWPSLMRAMQRPLLENPNAMLFMHTRSADEGGDLRDVWTSMHPEARKRMVNPGWKDQGFVLGRTELNALYNAADLYVSTSPEGFGLTIAEAIACGVPAVALDYSAVPEVVGPAGKLVPVSHLIDNPYAHFWAVPNERAFSEAVSSLLSDPRERSLLGAKGPFHVRSSFSWTAAAEKMAAVFMGERIEVAA